MVYLDFWASWCGPCRLSFPYMSWLHKIYADQGIIIIAVNVDHSRDLADKFLAEMHSSDLQVVYDPDGKLAAYYAIKGMPSSVLIGRDGRIRYTHTGFQQDQISTYNTHMTELISEKQ